MFWTYVIGAAGFALVFLISGALSVPRRWAVHLEAWLLQDRIATAFAALVVIATLMFVIRFVARLGRRPVRPAPLT